MSPTPPLPARANIASFLAPMAAAEPERLAIALPRRGWRRGTAIEYTEWSRDRLNRESDRLAHALLAVGIGRGVRTALMVKPGADFFALAFAIAKVGAVPVVIDPGIGLRHIKSSLAEVEPEAFIGIASAQAARLVLGWGRGTIKTSIGVGPAAWLGGHHLARLRRRAPDIPFPVADTRADEPAAIIFTSGSTGPPKGVLYTHGNFLAQIDSLRRIAAIEPGEIDLPTFPVFALFDPALGMSSVIPQMDGARPARADPRKIIGAIQRYSVTNMFASPALVDRLGRYGQAHGVRLPSLRRVVSAGAPVQPAVMERCLSMLGDDAEVITPYGATEALPVAVASSRRLLSPEFRRLTATGAGVYVGPPVDEVCLRIIKRSDEPVDQWRADLELPQGAVGEIVVQGPMVSRSYFNRPSATRLAKIAHPDGLMHRMGDLGYLDQEGGLWFCGRKAHCIDVAGKTLYSVCCEMIFNSHPAVGRSALVRLSKAGEAAVGLCVQLEPGMRKTNRVRAELLQLAGTHEATAPIVDFFFRRTFPVDIRHNAKIDRQTLGKWAQKKLGRA